MTAPSEREAIAQIIATEIGTACEYLEIGITADRIIAEHIAPLPAMMEYLRTEMNEACERDKEMRDIVEAAESRASALEALLAECETDLATLLATRHFDVARALLAKLKARKE